jgi:hypothetical protein
MPILHSPGLMMPGQLGPISRVLLCSLITFFTLTWRQSKGKRRENSGGSCCHMLAAAVSTLTHCSPLPYSSAAGFCWRWAATCTTSALLRPLPLPLLLSCLLIESGSWWHQTAETLEHAAAGNCFHPE